MTGPAAVVVAGGGPLGRRFAEMLVHHGYAGRVDLAGDEVRGIDRAGRRVLLGDGSGYAYDLLVLATGPDRRPSTPFPALVPTSDPSPIPTPFPAPVPTSDPSPVPTSDPGPVPATVTVHGDGVAAVRTAARLAARGAAVTLVCAGPHPMADRIDDGCAAMLAETIPATVVTGTGTGTGTAGPGTVLRCPEPRPNIRLAHAAGLRVGRGVLVDDAFRTSDPRIHAIGGCAERPGRPPVGAIEAWDQADSLAGLIAHGCPPAPVAADVLRLRAGNVDLTCLGPPMADHADLARPGPPVAGNVDQRPESGMRTIRLADRRGRRYARITLHGDRVVAAVLLGLPRAAALVAHGYRYGRPMPADRLGLLLDLPATRGDDGAPGPEPLVCVCNNVTRARLHTAWRSGHRGRDALAGHTRAGTGCGGCRDEIDRWCARWLTEAEA
ncbi:FAD-dependent oxidoreductase [Actinoplanes sp. NPDC049265]|uniref:FAD-dependent oxidoreductase n=1 Tax=Actinoplanes sp. NPDC049265 TaxID=3363902 RepID=UPI00371F7EFF